MKRLLILLLVTALTLSPLTAAAFFGGNVPSAPDATTDQTDDQPTIRYAGRAPDPANATPEP